MSAVALVVRRVEDTCLAVLIDGCACPAYVLECVEVRSGVAYAVCTVIDHVAWAAGSASGGLRVVDEAGVA